MTLLVTGAGRGLGYEYVCHALDRDEDVVALTRMDHVGEWIAGDHNSKTAYNFSSELGDPRLEARLQEFLTENDLRIDRVLHAAGGGLGHKEPLLSRNQLRELYVANIEGAIALNSVLVPKMIEHGQGRIVHVGSTAATHAVGSVGYNTVKAGLGAYVRSLGRILVPHNVIVTGINPGAFLAVDNAMERLRARNPEAFTQFESGRIPRGTMSSAAEILPIIDFLLFGEAEALAGSMIAADAGESLAYDS